jgi:hypothetical protein
MPTISALNKGSPLACLLFECSSPYAYETVCPRPSSETVVRDRVPPAMCLAPSVWLVVVKAKNKRENMKPEQKGKT